jgi:type II secretory pathway component HofQ
MTKYLSAEVNERHCNTLGGRFESGRAANAPTVSHAMEGTAVWEIHGEAVTGPDGGTTCDERGSIENQMEAQFQQVRDQLWTRNWKSVKAELGVKITPNISADNNVTLAIEVNQSNFTARIEPDAPPGQVSRTFNSLIRVKDGDMILLGGLEEIKKQDTGSGVPFLARVPVLKWFFSRRLKDNSDKKLNIFIKPTIIK